MHFRNKQQHKVNYCFNINSIPALSSYMEPKIHLLELTCRHVTCQHVTCQRV